MKLLEKHQEYSVDEVIAFCFNSGRDKLGRHIRDHRPLRPFVYDGASGFPDTVGDINTDPATLWHDIAYWSGLPEDRRARCVADHQLAIDAIELCGASAELASVLYHGPRVGGSEYLPTPWRWGFGR